MTRFFRVLPSLIVAVALALCVVASASATTRTRHLHRFSSTNSGMRQDSILATLTYDKVNGDPAEEMAVSLFQGSGIPKGVYNARDNVLSFFAAQFSDGSVFEVGTKYDQYGYRGFFYDDLGVICAGQYTTFKWDSITGQPVACIGTYDDFLGQGEDEIDISFDGTFFHPHIWNVKNETLTSIGTMLALTEKISLPELVTEEAWIDASNPWLAMGTNWWQPSENGVPWRTYSPLNLNDVPAGIEYGTTQGDNPCPSHYSLQPIGLTFSPPDPEVFWMGTPLGGYGGPWLCGGALPGWS